MKDKSDNDSNYSSEINFAEVIYNLRMKHNLTQKALADLIQVSDRTISKWENGITVPDIINIKNICDALNVSPSSIIKSKRTFKDYFRFINKSVKSLFNFCFKNILKISFLVLFLFLLIYFINNYNSMSIYILKYDNDNIGIEHRYFVENKNVNLLILDNINLKKVDYDSSNIKLVLYIYYEGDKKILYSANNLDDVFIYEYNGYQVILTDENIACMKSGLYIDIITDDNVYTAKMSLNEEYKNNKFFYKTSKEDIMDNINYSVKYYPNDIVKSYFMNTKVEYAFVDAKPTLEDLGFVYDEKEKVYIKIFNNTNVRYSKRVQTIVYKNFSKYGTIEIDFKIKGDELKIFIKDNDFDNTKIVYKVNDVKSLKEKINKKFWNEIDEFFLIYQEILTTL